MTALPRILLIPVAFGVLGAALFVMQGGFGGGHGSLDQVIFAVGLPAVLATTVSPVWPGDFLALVVLPALINTALWFVASRAFLAIRRRRV